MVKRRSMSDPDPLSTAHPAGYREIDVVGAHPNLGAFTILDVREPDEFVGPLGHLAGARLVPLATVTEAAAPWDRQARYLVVCRSGGRSGRACAALAGLGFQRVYNLVGGMLAWNDAGFYTER